VRKGEEGAAINKQCVELQMYNVSNRRMSSKRRRIEEEMRNFWGWKDDQQMAFT
jgi:hypothetical protein